MFSIKSLSKIAFVVACYSFFISFHEETATKYLAPEGRNAGSFHGEGAREGQQILDKGQMWRVCVSLHRWSPGNGGGLVCMPEAGS